jgi:hypothetical protein
MDLVIVLPGMGYVRLSPYNKNILRDANGTQMKQACGINCKCIGCGQAFSPNGFWKG